MPFHIASPGCWARLAVRALCRNDSRPSRSAAGGRRMMRAIKFLALAVVVFAGCLLAVLPARAQDKALDWPNRPVRMVVPFGAGGSADRLGRIAADHLSKVFKQQFYIE